MGDARPSQGDDTIKTSEFWEGADRRKARGGLSTNKSSVSGCGGP